MATVQVKQIDDEQIEIFANGMLIGFANHDEDGWAGMEKVEMIAEALAKALGADFERIYK